MLAGSLALAAPLLAACGGADGAAGDGDRAVVTSFYPLQYVAQRVAGDHADVTNLTQPGQEPHDLELTVQQTAEVADADVVVYEQGLPGRASTTPSTRTGPDARRRTPPSPADRVAATTRTSGSTRPGCPPVAAAVDEVSSPTPTRTTPRTTPATSRDLQGDLAGLDADFRDGPGDCRLDTIVVSHDAFGYLGRRYGLDVVGDHRPLPRRRAVARPPPPSCRT